MCFVCHKYSKEWRICSIYGVVLCFNVNLSCYIVLEIEWFAAASKLSFFLLLNFFSAMAKWSETWALRNRLQHVLMYVILFVKVFVQTDKLFKIIVVLVINKFLLSLINTVVLCESNFVMDFAFCKNLVQGFRVGLLMLFIYVLCAQTTDTCFTK